MKIDWKKIVGTVAPTLATALGGPLAGMATREISKAVLGKDSSDEKEISTAIMAAGPEALDSLKESNHAFEIRLKKLDISLEEIHSADRSNARQREIETKDNTPKILAGFVVTGFFLTLGLIIFKTLPDAAQAPVNILLGALTGLLLQVGNYYFGSSNGSSRKNEMMAKMMK